MHETIWNIKAAIYNSVRALPGIRQLYGAELRNLQRLAAGISAQRQLDLGCGTGSSLQCFRSSRKIFLADRSEAMLQIAVRRYPGFPAMRLDANAPLPFRDASFDLISAIGLFEYLPELNDVLQEIHRVSRRSGYFVLTSSPAVLANRLRLATGSRPILRHRGEMERALVQAGWHPQRFDRTWLQEQWLCAKK